MTTPATALRPAGLPIRRRAFRAMGTDVELLTVGGNEAGALDEARDLIVSLEARWSRFRPDSEVSRLNAAAGRPVTLPDDTLALVEAAIEAWRLTGGRFDPTVLGALVAAGYDRSFELVIRDGPPDDARPAPAVPGCAGIAIQRDTGLLRLPAGVALDLGGIAKGHAADRALAALLTGGASGALANLGGDVAVAGRAPDGGAWTIGIDDPHRPSQDLGTLVMSGGAVATSSRTRRRWTRGGRVSHHLIDPATGRPADRGVDAAVIVAGQARWAEVLAKAALIAGPDDGADLTGRFGATGLMILESGEVRRLPGIEEYLQ
jgi:thiamine biosynthesis lipoprotein